MNRVEALKIYEEIKKDPNFGLVNKKNDPELKVDILSHAFKLTCKELKYKVEDPDNYNYLKAKFRLFEVAFTGAVPDCFPIETYHKDERFAEFREFFPYDFYWAFAGNIARDYVKTRLYNNEWEATKLIETHPFLFTQDL